MRFGIYYLKYDINQVIVSIPLDVRLELAQSVPNYFKTMTNYMTYQTQKYGDNVFIRYYSRNESKPMYKTLIYKEVDCITTNLACKWFEYTKDHETVAFFAAYSASYLIVMLTLFNLRVAMLCISPRNSEISIVNLLKKTNYKLIIASETYLGLANNSANQIPNTKVIHFPYLKFETLSKEPFNPDANILIDTQFSDADITKATLIIHG